MKFISANITTARIKNILKIQKKDHTKNFHQRNNKKPLTLVDIKKLDAKIKNFDQYIFQKNCYTMTL